MVSEPKRAGMKNVLLGDANVLLIDPYVQELRYEKVLDSPMTGDDICALLSSPGRRVRHFHNTSLAFGEGDTLYEDFENRSRERVHMFRFRSMEDHLFFGTCLVLPAFTCRGQSPDTSGIIFEREVEFLGEDQNPLYDPFCETVEQPLAIERILDLREHDVVLLYFLGWQVNEISDLYGVSENSIKNWMKVGRADVLRLWREDAPGRHSSAAQFKLPPVVFFELVMEAIEVKHESLRRKPVLTDDDLKERDWLERYPLGRCQLSHRDRRDRTMQGFPIEKWYD